MNGAPSTPLAAIEQMPLAVALRGELWLYPAVEIVHIVGFATLVGGILVLDLRLLGFARGLSVRELARHVLPWTAGALLLIVPTGLLLFIAHAGDLIGNPAFQMKMVLLMLAGINAAAFHAGVFRGAVAWDRAMPPPAARLHAVASIAIWLAVIACGRLLAYV